MRFEILNVEHGFCAYAIGSDGGVLLFDCGHGTANCPSTDLPARDISCIQRFFVTNYDEDHISDLLAVRRNLDIEVLTRNPSMTSSQIRSLKTPPISPAMTELLGMIDSFTGEVSPQQLQPAGLKVWLFHNDYPTFTDTNNLSLLTFLDVGDLSFVLGSDLERAGWLALLQKPDVQSLLKRVDVFVASHHGRESGYCPEVFNYCRPRIVVMSDGSIQYDTQLMASTYAQHASGELFSTPSGQETRKVVTTRKDGNICWNP
jgi:beta-lactamase superfamily II metal-dependent hydrolase